MSKWTKNSRRAMAVFAAAATIAAGAAWTARQVPLDWEHGEFRASKTTVDLEFTSAIELKRFEPPRDLVSAPTRARLYTLDLLTQAGWEILDVEQSEREWVYLMRRAR
jgi:hypothetical protein